MIPRAPYGRKDVQLVHPEFGVLHSSDVQNATGAYSFNPSSGPYWLVSADPAKKYVLQRNPYYPHFGLDAPKSLTIEFLPSERQITELKAGTLDFSVPIDLTSFDGILDQLSRNGISYTVPHIGFSYWLTLNPETSALRDVRTRNWIQDLIHEHLFRGIPASGIPWAGAEQLYLPDGVGRPDGHDLELTWKKIEQNARNAPLPRQLKILTSSTFPFNTDFRVREFPSFFPPWSFHFPWNSPKIQSVRYIV